MSSTSGNGNWKVQHGDRDGILRVLYMLRSPHTGKCARLEATVRDHILQLDARFSAGLRLLGLLWSEVNKKQKQVLNTVQYGYVVTVPATRVRYNDMFSIYPPGHLNLRYLLVLKTAPLKTAPVWRQR